MLDLGLDINALNLHKTLRDRTLVKPHGTRMKPHANAAKPCKDLEKPYETLQKSPAKPGQKSMKTLHTKTPKPKTLNPKGLGLAF